MDLIAGWIDTVCRNLDNLDQTAEEVRAEVAELCSQFDVPGIGRAAEAGQAAQSTF